MIYILIPTYNEELNIERLSRNLQQHISSENFYFVFSDDCSSDNTVGLISKYFKTPNLKIIESEKNHGPGAVFNKGFNWILNNYSSKKDVVVTMEADSTSDLGILETMLLLNRQGFHLVLASIYSQGGGFFKTSMFRRIISFVANLILRLIFDIKVLTLSSFYRVYSLEKLLEVKAKHGELITQNGFVCMVELLLKFIRTDAKIIEVPMSLKSTNRIGKSKMKILKTSAEYIRFLFTVK